MQRSIISVLSCSVLLPRSGFRSQPKGHASRQSCRLTGRGRCLHWAGSVLPRPGGPGHKRSGTHDDAWCWLHGLALDDDEAAAVVLDLDLLIPAVETSPCPRRLTTITLPTWPCWPGSRLAEFRDPASHQRLINNDRHLFGDLGLGVQQGQVTCGFERWNAAYDLAFPD